MSYIYNYPPIIPGHITFIGVKLSKNLIVGGIIGWLALFGLRFMTKYSNIGRAIIAIPQSTRGSQIIGIDITRVQSFVYFLGGLLLGLGAYFYGGYLGVNAHMWTHPLIIMFTITVAGGLGSIDGVNNCDPLNRNIRSSCCYAYRSETKKCCHIIGWTSHTDIPTQGVRWKADWLTQEGYIMSKNSTKWIAVFFLLSAGTFLFKTHLYVLIYASFFGIFAMSWSFFTSFSGYLNLGHVIFIGIAGYTTAILNYHLSIPMFFSIPVGIIAGAGGGWLLSKSVAPKNFRLKF